MLLLYLLTNSKTLANNRNGTWHHHPQHNSPSTACTAQSYLPPFPHLQYTIQNRWVAEVGDHEFPQVSWPPQWHLLLSLLRLHEQKNASSINMTSVVCIQHHLLLLAMTNYWLSVPKFVFFLGHCSTKRL
jgi:hypothetical protein